LDLTSSNIPSDNITASTTNVVTTFKYSGGIAVGGSTAVGCDYKLNDLLSIYAEIYYDALSYAPTKGKYTKYAQDGTDLLPSLTTRDKEVKFVKDRTDYLQGSRPSGDPNQQVKNSYPFNSLGLNLGVKIRL
jgi:hypothetical protein